MHNFFVFNLLLIILPAFGFTQIPLQIEVANTTEQKKWGLMQRKTLPPNYGMLFVNEHPKPMVVWMYNCYMDLAIAFLDEKGVIREIHEMKAYPEKMARVKPIRNLEDLKNLNPYDPLVRFFVEKSTVSSFVPAYALEMESKWFEKHGVKIGDVVKLTPPTLIEQH